MGTRREDDEQKGALAEDDLDDKDTERLLAEGEIVGTWSDDEDDDDLLSGDDSVGPWSEDDLEFGLRADSEGPDDEELTQESVDEAADEDVDQLTDMPDPRARR